MAIVINGSGTVSGLTEQASNVELTDNTKILVGTGDDLQIYHDGSDSIINEEGTGTLIVMSNGTGINLQKGTSETMAQFVVDGAVNLYHNNVKKFETTATGFTLTGTAGTSPLLELNNGDSEDNDTGRESTLRFTGKRSGGEATTNAQISAHHDGSSDDNKGMLLFSTNDGSNITEKMRIKENGLVGIGTTNPSNLLTLREGGGDLSSTTVARAEETGLKIYESTNGANNGNGIWFDHGSLIAGIASARASSSNWGTDLRFYTHPTVTNNQHDTFERMRIEANGNVYIGTIVEPQNGTAGLEIRPGGSIRMGTTASGSHNMFEFNNANGNVGKIVTSGSGTAYNTSSDYRLKENVDYDWDATTRLKQLKPARFNFIADDTTTVDGFLAHEAQAVVPECVTGTKDAMMDEEYEITPAVIDDETFTVVTEAVMGTRSLPDYQGIDQSKLVPLLVKTIQELEARITALEA